MSSCAALDVGCLLSTGQNILCVKDKNSSQKPYSDHIPVSKCELNYSLKTLTKMQLQRLTIRLSDVRDGKGREKDGSYLSMKD